MGLSALLIHLASLRSFGIPFLEPLAPIILSDMKDTLIRFPWWAMTTRPKLLSKNRIRQAPGSKPGPPSPEEKSTWGEGGKRD